MEQPFSRAARRQRSKREDDDNSGTRACVRVIFIQSPVIAAVVLTL